VSIDSIVPETYAKIRKKGNLSMVLANLERIEEYDRDRVQRGLGSLGIMVNFLIQRDNWRELGLIHQFENERKLGVFRYLLKEPAEYSLLTLDTVDREQIIEFYLENLSKIELKNSMRIIVPLLDSLPTVSRGDYWLRLRDRVQTPVSRKIETPQLL
jgi:hypothetical protein